MLEVLPPGTSKGKGVEVLLAHLGIDPMRLMALGERARVVGYVAQSGVNKKVSMPAPLVCRWLILLRESEMLDLISGRSSSSFEEVAQTTD